MSLLDGSLLVLCFVGLWSMAKLLHLPFWLMLVILTAGGGATVGFGEFM